MKLLGHCFQADGSLDCEIEVNGKKGVVVIPPDAVRAGPHRLVPVMFASLERARRKYETGVDSPEKETPQ